MKETRLAYMAGIIDGEGCLTIAKQIRKTRKSPAYRCSITVSNTDIRVVEIFSKEFEGIVYKRPDKRTQKKWADSYTWYCPCRSVVGFLEKMMPYLILKKTQAKLLIAFQNKKSYYVRKSLGRGKGSSPLSEKEIEYKEKIYHKVKGLNTKGGYSRSIKNLNYEQSKSIAAI